MVKKLLSEKDVYEVLTHISDSDERCASDVVYALILLNTNISKMLESVKCQMLDVISNNDFDKLDKLKVFCNNIMELQKQVDSSIDALVSGSANAQKANDEIVTATNENDLPVSIRRNAENNSLIDYSDYEVNKYEPHYLNEDFEYKRICAFNFTGKLQKINSWKDAIIVLCRDLYKQDKSKFIAMTKDEKLKGKSIPYFSNCVFLGKDGRPRNNLIPDTDIYVYTNLSANDIVKLIKKILKYFKISLNDCVVYLRADYQPLHKKEEE